MQRLKRIPVPRRRFLALSGVAAGSWLLASPRTAFAYSAHERLRLAVVGMAGYGAWHGFAELIHDYGNAAYAVSCDVDLRKVKRVYDLWDKRAAEWAASNQLAERTAARDFYRPLAAKRPPLFSDFREMFDKAADQFDAVVVATPDHTHAIPFSAVPSAQHPVIVVHASGEAGRI
jgi:predicted dehydrogenase